jgi:lysophospholipase L1-like esterase
MTMPMGGLLLKSLAGFAGACVLIGATSVALAEVRIVALGDSGIRGKGVSSSESYPGQLEAALKARGHQVKVTNQGVNGDTTTGVLARLDSAVPAGTNIVVLSVGVNDTVLHHVPESQVSANKQLITQRLRAKGAEVYVIEKMQEGLIDRAELHVETVHNSANTEWHLNAAGYALVVKRTLPAIEALVKKAETGH